MSNEQLRRMSNRDVADFTNNPHFKSSEMKCKCSKCKAPYLYKELLEKLTLARGKAKIPFIINSGCRCPQHNKDVKGSTNSDHLATPPNSLSSGEGRGEGEYLCCGVDIHCVDDRKRFTIIKSLLDVGINRIGLDEKFIHAGIDKRNPGEVIWFYKS